MNNKSYIIAEIGVNHNGDIEKACDLVTHAKECGADAVKFQTFEPELLVTPRLGKSPYQVNNTHTNESQLSMLRKYQLTRDEHQKLYLLSKKIKIDFISTPFDTKSLDYLVKILKLKTIKISSTDVKNIPYLIEVGATNKNIIISSGMSTIDDIDLALSALSFGFKYKGDLLKKKFSHVKHKKHYKVEKKFIQKKIALLHCTSEYPAPLNELNLNVLQTLRERYKIKVGYSDHSANILTGSIARSLGAEIIETHITINKNLKGPDHKSSLNIQEFKRYIDNIRLTEEMLGVSKKIVTKSEKKNISKSLKTLVAIKDIKYGEKFTKHNIGIMRSGSGINPCEYFSYLGKKSSKDIKIYTTIKKNYIGT